MQETSVEEILKEYENCTLEAQDEGVNLEKVEEV